ncbi:hypothetical protein MMC07_003572 [Pseudocyphellaria aurata]|nr:hypothetical protein [Pseudocyphellaria aurata]
MTGKVAHPEVIFGCASFGDPSDLQAKFNSTANTLPLLEHLRARGVTHLDTARAYPVGAPGTSEALLGTLGVGSWATVDTKVTSWMPGSHTAEGIAGSIAGSLHALNMVSVNVMYLHVPDRATPFEITCRAMDQAHREGKFDRFGVSNYTAEEVEKIVEICERDGLIKPTVYQGRYNALLRSGETSLFPTLRKHGISFYAYSPAAAGMLSGAVSRESTSIAGSRWDSGTILGQAYQDDYFKPALFAASQRMLEIASSASTSTTSTSTSTSTSTTPVTQNGHAIALRWIMFHSGLSAAHGDCIVLGASSLEQCARNLDAFDQGPLDPRTAARMDEVWEIAREQAPAYHR